MQDQELGVTPPLGFWDPLGFSKFDDPEAERTPKAQLVHVEFHVDA